MRFSALSHALAVYLAAEPGGRLEREAWEYIWAHAVPGTEAPDLARRQAPTRRAAEPDRAPAGSGQ